MPPKQKNAQQRRQEPSPESVTRSQYLALIEREKRSHPDFTAIRAKYGLPGVYMSSDMLERFTKELYTLSIEQNPIRQQEARQVQSFLQNEEQKSDIVSNITSRKIAKRIVENLDLPQLRGLSHANKIKKIKGLIDIVERSSSTMSPNELAKYWSMLNDLYTGKPSQQAIDQFTKLLPLIDYKHKLIKETQKKRTQLLQAKSDKLRDQLVRKSKTITEKINPLDM